METKQLIKEIREFNPFCEHITLTTIFSKLGIGRVNAISFGKAGVGKSQSSVVLLELLDLGNEIVMDNNTTKRGFFETVMNYPECDIVMDECSTLLKDKATQDSIKLCMEGKSITWIKKDSIETTPEFKGNFIINTNEPVMPSVIDRCYFNKTLMNKEMTLNFIDYTLKHHDFKDLIKYFKKVIKDKRKVVLTSEETKQIYAFIKQHIQNSEDGLEYSRRCVNRILTYFMCAKKLFGSLNEEVMNYIKKFAQLYIINQKTPSLLEAIVSSGEIDKVELINKLSKEGNYSQGHARRLVREAIEQGTLTTKGRMVKQK